MEEQQENNPSSASPPSSPPPPPAPDPPQPESQPEPQPSPSASSNPSSSDAKTNLEIVPISTPEANPNPFSIRHPKSPAKKNPPLPWTHQETVSLIQAYQEKWYSLKKGQLKANQWEDVAATVAARCGYEVPSKTATQCRHKIEKLRKRYRAERLKPYPNSWQYFELMDHMERGPMPAIAVRSVSAAKYQNQKNAGAAGFVSKYREKKGDTGDVGFEAKKNKLKSVNNIVRGSDVDADYTSNRNLNKVGVSRNFGVSENARVLRGLRTPLVQKRKGYFQDEESEDEDEDDDDEDELDEGEELEAEVELEEKGRGGLGKALAAEIKGFAERFLNMENMKMDMMRETERTRMEMEKKRTEMILEAQRKVVDTIGKAFGAHKKPKKAPES